MQRILGHTGTDGFTLDKKRNDDLFRTLFRAKTGLKYDGRDFSKKIKFFMGNVERKKCHGVLVSP
jgi:hypothetical protein